MRWLARDRTREALAAWTFLSPFLLFLLVFFVYAFGRTVFFSFTDYNLFRWGRLVGAENYARIVGDPLFLTALRNTPFYCVVVVTLQTLGALLLAVVLNQRLRGLAFFRTAFYTPSITSSVVITLIFIWLFQPRGTVAFLLTTAANFAGPILAFVLVVIVAQAVQVLVERRHGLPAAPFDPALLVISLLAAAFLTWLLTAAGYLHVGDAPVRPLNWLFTRELFLGLIPYPLLFIIVQNTFTTVPTLMLFFLAGLQGIPRAAYEAAALDGATPWQQLRYVTVPLLRPVTFYVVTVGIIGTLQLFDQVSLLQGTAPLESTVSLAYYVFNNVFPPGALPRVGLASAGALILAALTIIAVLLQRRFLVREEGYT